MRSSTSSQRSKLMEGQKVWVKVGRSNHVATVKHVHRRTATVKWWIRGDIEEVKIANIEQWIGQQVQGIMLLLAVSVFFLLMHFHHLVCKYIEDSLAHSAALTKGESNNLSKNADAVRVTQRGKDLCCRGSDTGAFRCPSETKIGDIGYTFSKLFNAGWFEGKVIQIRTCASELFFYRNCVNLSKRLMHKCLLEDGKTRRVEYSDGDLEDLSVKDLRNLAKFAKKRTCGNHKPNASSAGKARQSTILFDQNEYDELYQRYLSERNERKMHVLPSGMTIRKWHRGRYIDLLPECKSLKTKIDALLKARDHKEVYIILSQLRKWEINPQNNTGIFDDQEDSEDVQYQEYVDSTQTDNYFDLT